MKILLCTKHDLIGSMMLNLLLPELVARHDVSVLLANRRRPELEAIPELAWMKCFEQDLTAQLIFPLLDKKRALSAAETASNAPDYLSFDGLAQTYGVPFTNAGHISNHQWLTDYVFAQTPDLIVSFQFGFIFKDAVLTLPKLGAINLHSGVLPQRAGVNPTFWCMKDGDSHMGCSLHRIEIGIDAGPLIATSSREIDYKRSFFANWVRNYIDGAALIRQAITTLEQEEHWRLEPQDLSQLCYVPTPTRQDVLAFLAAGHRLIDPIDLLGALRAYLPKDVAACDSFLLPTHD
jgi:methionyl-tRNA formyltransferase